MNIKCWWIGHECNEYDEPAQALCDRCGELLGYSDFVEYCRYEKVKRFFKYWILLKWRPEKCIDCGKRYGNHDKCIPF